MKSNTNNSLERLYEAYILAKHRNKVSDRDVAKKYLVQGPTMISKVLTGAAISRPVLTGVVQFVNDVSPELLPEEYKELLADSREMVGEI